MTELQIPEIGWWQALILGAVQGIGEYLPISSSGHLAITQQIFGLQLPLAVDVLLHLATLIPTVWVFRQKIVSLLRSFVLLPGSCFRRLPLTPKIHQDARYIALILVATACTFATAFPQRNLNLKARPLLVAAAFLITAGLLLLQHLVLQHRAKKQKKIINDVSKNLLLSAPLQKAVLFAACIGLAQGIAAVPGISRSGMTISIALLFGIQRRAAGEFSFIISIPVIAGAFLLDAKELSALFQPGSAPNTAIGIVLAFFTALLSGFFALRILLALLQKNHFYIFSLYLVALASFSFWYFA